MKITVAHSPDSDDAFMFYGLASGAVQVEGIEVDQVLADIETLNAAAFEGKYEVTRRLVPRLRAPAGSLRAAAARREHGRPVRPDPRRAAAQPHRPDARSLCRASRSAIPGRLTSAYLALQMYDPSFDAEVMPFDEIQQAVVDGRVDAGLLIHEGQLTYAADGLRKVVDLGEWWFERTGGLPLPLGGNIIRRDLGARAMRTCRGCCTTASRTRLRTAPRPSNTRSSSAAASTASDTDEFVGMYVNQLTLDYGKRGRAALERFFGDAFEKGLIPQRVSADFV